MTQLFNDPNVLAEVQKKAKERTVKTQNVEYDLETLVKKLERSTIKLDPDYQRLHRWDSNTSSRLIESLILNIPIPIIYISQDVDVDLEVGEEEARYTVIDGQQRLRAILDYMTNKYSLGGLDVLPELNGLFHRDLPPFLVRRLEERTIKCLRIDSTIDSQVKYDIFERLNSGSIKLEAQELRNAVERGPFNDAIKLLAAESEFRKLLQIGQDANEHNRVKKMEDVELVLRFMSLIDNRYQTRSDISDGFGRYLTQSMKEYSKLTEDQINALSERFKKVIHIALDKFGETAFAKYKISNGRRTFASRFNAAVFDALAVAIDAEIDLENPIISPKAVEEYEGLFKDSRFISSISGSVNDKSKIAYRIDSVRNILKK